MKWKADTHTGRRYGTLGIGHDMASEKNVALPEDLLAAVSESARAEGKTTDELIEAATRRYLYQERLDRFVRRNEQRARELGISEGDVPRLIHEHRREQRGR